MRHLNQNEYRYYGLNISSLDFIGEGGEGRVYYMPDNNKSQKYVLL